MYVCMYKCPQSFLPTETRTTQTPSSVHAIASSFTPSWSFSYNLSPLRQGQQQQTSCTHEDWPHLVPPHLIQSEFSHSRHKLRSVTDRLTGPDHEEQSSLAGSPHMQPHCACSGKAVTCGIHGAWQWSRAPSRSMWPHLLPTYKWIHTIFIFLGVGYLTQDDFFSSFSHFPINIMMPVLKQPSTAPLC